MTNRTEALVAVADPALEQALEGAEAVDAVARCVRREALVRSATSLRPHVAVVSLALPGEMAWEEVWARLRAAGVRVILLAPGAEPGDPALIQAVEAGVYDILPAPDPEAVLERIAQPATLREARRWLPAAAAPAPDGGAAGGQERNRQYRRGKMVVSWSPKGGAGKTTLACELAFQAARCGRRVILIDLNLGNPEAGGRLGIVGRRPGQGLNELLQAGVTAERLVAACQKAHGCLVLGPDRPGAGGGAGFLDLTLEEAERVLDAALAAADLVIVDTSTMMNDPATYAALRRADTVLLVTEQPRTVVETVQAQARLLARIGQSPRLVVNKYDAEMGAGVRDIEQFFGAAACAVIPHDRAGYARAMLEGLPYSAIANGNARPWEVLAQAVLGLPKHAPARRRGWSPAMLWKRVAG